MDLFGYTKERRSAFWQFAAANNIPHVRTGQRKIQFPEQAVLDWINRRSNTRAVTGS
jgi:predicted DNA-binding transcriptional regulator AlpA